VILSKREKYIALATIVAVIVLGLDYYLLTPFLDRRAELRTEKQNLLAEFSRARALFARRKLLTPEWRRMTGSGISSDPVEADAQVLNRVREWFQQSELNITSLKPERTSDREEPLEIAFQVAGTGPMRSVARFLWLLETSPLPVKIKHLQIGSRKEGVDDLTVQLRISALCLRAPKGPAVFEAETMKSRKERE